MSQVSPSHQVVNGDARPIGVFDSGIGGLTVVAALRRLLPNESIYYVGDTARVPYGGKSAATVQRYSSEIAQLLLGENAKTIVIACNTASALALPVLEQQLPVSVTGVIEPGARAAVAATRNGHIGVIGTRATIKSGAYERALLSQNAQLQITARACPLLVPLIEEGWLESTVTDQVLLQYLEPMIADGIDTLVLGCTHYPLLRPAIHRLLGDAVTLVDSTENCARAVQHLLASSSQTAPAGGEGNLQVALTDPPDAFLEIAHDALQLQLGDVQLRRL
jgi:glutamate racemase